MSLYKPQRYIGVMSGTSLDGIDVVIAQCHGSNFTILHTYQHPIPLDIRNTVHALNEGQLITLDELGMLDQAFGQLFAESILAILAQSKLRPKDIIAIGCHGQNIRHKPSIPFPFTMQIGDPNIIVKKTGIQTVADFRRADVALGGQGAPLVPAFHSYLFHSKEEDRVVLNLGGIANITFLSKKTELPIKGYDTGPANALIDLWAEKHLGKPYDENGAWAKSGTLHPDLLNSMLKDGYFSQKAPKSTGKELFNLNWIESHLKPYSLIQPQDVQATLLALTLCSVSQEILKVMPKGGRVLVCGGGVHNQALMEGLSTHLNTCIVESCEKHGMHPDWVEAACFAWLGYQRVHLQPGNLPEVTGAKHPTVLGALYAI